MEYISVFAYTWSTAVSDNKNILIRMFGLDKENTSVLVTVTDFQPHVYIELPESIQWENKISILMRKINEVCGYCRPSEYNLVYKQKLYYAHKNSDGTDKLFPYLRVSFRSYYGISQLTRKLPENIDVYGIGEINIKIHEQDASAVLQLLCERNLPSSGWIKIYGQRMASKESSCTHEFAVSYKNIQGIWDCNDIPMPTVLSFDIEVNSSKIHKMPSASIPDDKIFQISCVVHKHGNIFKYLISLGKPDQSIVGDDVTLICCKTETSLLIAFKDLSQTINPQIFVGYNIFGFDIPYMIDRSRYNLCVNNFDQLGFMIGQHAKDTTIKWSSSAYRDQEFRFLDAEGRLFIDLLPIVRRDYKLDNYKLSTVSKMFVGDYKDPLTAQDIFSCYRQFTDKSLGIVGKYCIKDSELVLKLFDHMKCWVGLCEMAKTCNVPVFYLYTQGQQIKVYSQIYKECYSKNIVVEKNAYIPGENDHYTGAYVFDPEPGLYDMVVPFDFSSLYPSTLIAYNIDYTTLVLDETISDEQCHIFEWEDHIGCEHDTTIRKTKPKNIMCAHHKYRFLKDSQGIVPTLLANLLSARKKTNQQIKLLKSKLETTETQTEKVAILNEIDILDKRQLSYKVSANSVYGSMGVTKGYLPFMPGAMCTTSKGRECLSKAAAFIKNTYGGVIVYGDTDSTLVKFPTITHPRDLWEFCKHVETEMAALFPKPMKLAFEEKIYWRFFILTKKRYMSLECDKDGNVSDKISKKGVLLARRDNSEFIKDLYADVSMRIFRRESKEDILEQILFQINEMLTLKIPASKFIVTKSVADISAYKIRSLPEDTVKREKRLRDLKCTEEEYDIKALPAHIQLSEKMKFRGKLVESGSRIEYVVIKAFGKKLFDRIEDVEYFRRHSEILRLDYLYYVHFLVNPIDQLLEAAFGEKKFMECLYKYHAQKNKINASIEDKTKPDLVFID